MMKDEMREIWYTKRVMIFSMSVYEDEFRDIMRVCAAGGMYV